MPFTIACTLILVQIEFNMCQIQGGVWLFLSFSTILYFKLETWKVIPKGSADQSGLTFYLKRMLWVTTQPTGLSPSCIVDLRPNDGDRRHPLSGTSGRSFYDQAPDQAH